MNTHGEHESGGTDCPMCEPSQALTGRARSWWVVRTDNNSHVTSRDGSRAGEGGVQVYERSVDEPAPTVDTKFVFTLHTNRGQNTDGSRQTRESSAPAPALSAKAGGQWAFDRPATTVCGDPRLGAPGHRDRAGGERQFDNAVRLTLRDALVLQSFRPDYPVQGTKTSAFRQVGNAICPGLARAVLGQFIETAK